MEQIEQIAERIRGLREIVDVSPEEMARVTGLTAEEYLECENGTQDFTFTFLYNCAKRLGVNITELLTGEMPKLSLYSIVRKGEGLPIERRKGFHYQNMAYLFRDRYAEPFIVTAPQAAPDEPLHYSIHKGQEFDIVDTGHLAITFESGQHEILGPGDAIYYDSSNGHDVRAVDGPCRFLAVVIRAEEKNLK